MSLIQKPRSAWWPAGCAAVFVACRLLAADPAVPNAPAVSADPVTEAIAKARSQPPREALRTLQRVETHAAAHRADLLANIAIAWSDCVDVADEQRNKSAAEHASRRSFETAERALKADPNNARAHLAMAMAAGRMTDYSDTAGMVTLSRRVKDEAERAIALNPKEDGAYYVLGRWHFGVASVNPFLKFAARMVVGALPPASLKEAAHNLEKAVALSPGEIEYRRQLALVYQAMGKKEKAGQQWKTILKLPANSSEDAQAKAEARAFH